MKKLILLLVVFSLMAGYVYADVIDDINDYLQGEASFETGGDIEAGNLAFENDIISLSYGSHVLELNLAEKEILSEFEVIKFTTRDYEGEKLPLLSLEQKDAKRIIGITHIDGKGTAIYLSKMNPKVGASIVYLVHHDRDGETYLDVVTNKKAQLLIENDGMTTWVKDGIVRLSTKSILNQDLLKQKREIDFTDQAVLELYTPGEGLIIKEGEYREAPEEDRHFTVEQSKTVIVETSKIEGWLEKAPDVPICEKEAACGTYHTSVEDKAYTCYCMDYDGSWDWWHEAGDKIIKCQGAATSFKEEGDYTLACCKQDTCQEEKSGECNKFGFMTLRQDEVETVKVFTGPGGWILRSFAAKGFLWGGFPDTDEDAAKRFVEKAWEEMLNPVVRVIGGGSDENQADAKAADFITFISDLHAGITIPDGKKLVIQIGNEPNIHDIAPEAYANLIKAIDAGLAKDVRVDVLLTTAGLSPDGGRHITYAKNIFNEAAFLNAFDIWGSHPYPSWSAAGLGVPLLYKDEVPDDFAKPVLITEAGQGVNDYDDTVNVKGAIESFRGWNHDENVIGVTLFILQDTTEENGVSRAVTSWVGAGTKGSQIKYPRPQFEALKVGGDRRAETLPAECRYDIGAFNNNQKRPDEEPSTAFAYGIQAHAYWQDKEGLAKKIKDLRFDWVKQQLIMEDINQQGDTIIDAEVENMIDAYHDKGLSILLSLTGKGDLNRDEYKEQYLDFVAAVVKTYGSRIDAVEIWNEENLKQGSAQIVGYAQYNSVLCNAYTGIKEAAPSLIVVSGAPTPTGVNDGVIAIDDAEYLRNLYGLGGKNIKDCSDAVGIHPSGYDIAPDVTCEQVNCPHRSRSFRSTMQTYRDIMLDHQDGDKKIWATEFGWAADLDPCPIEHYEYCQQNSLEDQFAYTKKAFDLCREEWSGWCGVMFLWNLNFRLVSPGKEQALWGILDENSALLWGDKWLEYRNS